MSERPSGWAAGWVFFAGVMLLLAGLWQAFIGLVALANDTFWVVGQKWVAQFNVSTWGWIHLLVGIFLFLVGIFVLKAATWARVVGIVIAGLSAFVNFLWLPWYPIWAILIIVVDVFIIWALAAHGEDVKLIGDSN